MKPHPTPLHAARSLARRLGVTGSPGGHIRDRNGRVLAHGWAAWARIGVLTGVIRPGQFVRYTDGGTVRLGLTRSVAVDVAGHQVWQTIKLETFS